MIRSREQLRDMQRNTTADREERIVSTGGGGEAVARVRQFLLKSVADDYLVCRRIAWADRPEFVEGDTDVYIAKPYHLQKQWYDGKTINGKTYTYASGTSRTVTVDGATESQVIIPTYQVEEGDYPGDLVLAIYVPNGTGVVDANDDAVYWQELAQGRMWAKVET